MEKMNYYEIFQKISIMPVLSVNALVQWSPAIQFFLVATGILISFLTAYYRGDVNANLPFLSETGAYSPEQCFFSMSLFMGSLIGSVFIIFRYLVIADNPLCDRRNFRLLNQGSLAIGLLSMVFLGGIAAFPMTTVFWAHLLVAGGYFGCSAFYLVLSTTVTQYTNSASKLFSFRLILTIMVCVYQVILIIIFPIALVQWNEFNEKIPALKTPKDKGFNLLLIASILEWSIVTSIISYHLSFIFEFLKYELCLKAKKIASDASDDDVAEAPV